jgi:AcrR family transcriptional regulator
MSHNDHTPSDEEKRARILEAAFEVCGRRGVATARMEEVAACAQVSKATLYRFFASKQQLLLAALVASYNEDLRLAYEYAEPAPDPRRELDLLLEGLVRVLEKGTPGMGVFYQVWGVVADDPTSRNEIDAFFQKFHAERNRELAQLLRRGQLAGVFRADVSPEVVAQGVSALLDGYCYWATFDPASATPDALRACFDTLVRGVLVVDAPTRPPDGAESPGRERAE